MLNNSTQEKICKSCNIFKKLNEFHKSSISKDGHKPICKVCKKEQRHKEYINNKDHQDNLNKLWKKTHKERMSILNKRYNEKRKEYLKQYRINNRKRRAELQKNRLKNNPNYNITSKLRHRLGMALKSQNVRKTNKALELLGCTLEEFRLHLQSQFKRGMSWKNYGKWHIDHIKPCAKFNLKELDQQKMCFHYSNMQPLWANENQSKWIN